MSCRARFESNDGSSIKMSRGNLTVRHATGVEEVHAILGEGVVFDQMTATLTVAVYTRTVDEDTKIETRGTGSLSFKIVRGPQSIREEMRAAYLRNKPKADAAKAAVMKLTPVAEAGSQ